MRLAFLTPTAHRVKPWRRRLVAAWLKRLGRREDAAVLLSRSVPGMFRQDEIRLLYRTARDAPGPGDYAEIGSWKGRTSIVQALALRDGRISGAKLYAIDTHDGGLDLIERVAHEGGSTLPQFRANVRSVGLSELIDEMVMPSERAAEVLGERGVRLRMLFIDGAHDEASVRRDIRAFLPLMNPRGIIALHDFDHDRWPGVTKAYHAELADKVDVVERASHLLITRWRR